LDILVREAGGTFTSIDGLAGPHGGSAVATNGRLHETVLSRLSA
jgi:histidinol-phosphatase